MSTASPSPFYKHIVILTRAGVSAESGIPTFRGAGGLWRSFPPEALATPQAFVRRPSLVWEFYSWRREVVAACQPNRAHHAIAALERRMAGDGHGAGFMLITQNVRGREEADSVPGAEERLQACLVSCRRHRAAAHT